MTNFKKLLLTLIVATGTMMVEAASQPILKNNTSYTMIVSFISSNNAASMTNRNGLSNTLFSVPANTSISIPAGYDTISAIESIPGLNLQNVPTLQSTSIKANKSYQINAVQHNSILQLVQI